MASFFIIKNFLSSDEILEMNKYLDNYKKFDKNYICVKFIKFIYLIERFFEIYEQIFY